MKKGLKIYTVEFDGVYPVGSCLILAAFDKKQAEEMAAKTITHTNKFTVRELTINKPTIVEYISGDY